MDAVVAVGREGPQDALANRGCGEFFLSHEGVAWRTKSRKALTFNTTSLDRRDTFWLEYRLATFERR
jgi:hypothetical protein